MIALHTGRTAIAASIVIFIIICHYTIAVEGRVRELAATKKGTPVKNTYNVNRSKKCSY